MRDDDRVERLKLQLPGADPAPPLQRVRADPLGELVPDRVAIAHLGAEPRERHDARAVVGDRRDRGNRDHEQPDLGDAPTVGLHPSEPEEGEGGEAEDGEHAHADGDWVRARVTAAATTERMPRRRDTDRVNNSVPKVTSAMSAVKPSWFRDPITPWIGPSDAMSP